MPIYCLLRQYIGICCCAFEDINSNFLFFPSFLQRTEEFQLEKESELRFEVESGATVQLEVTINLNIRVLVVQSIVGLVSSLRTQLKYFTTLYNQIH